MKYVFNASPNYRDHVSTSGIMRDLTIGLAVVFVFGLINQYVTYGMDNLVHSIVMMVAALATTLVTEAVWALARKKSVGSTLAHSYGWVTAIIFVLMLPSTATIYSVVVCSFLAILFGKLLFGGFGHNIFNPAAVARALVFASFASATAVDVVSKATPVSTFANAGWVAASAESFDQFLASFGGLFNFALGLYPGAIGETSFILIALVGVVLAWRKVIDWRVPVTYIVTLFVLAFGLGVINGQPLTYGLYHILTGGAIFGAVFMLTDPVTSPTSASGRIFFAMGAAILTLVIRVGASLPEGVLYSILLMNMVTPLIEKLFDGNQIDMKAKLVRYNGILGIVGLVIMVVMSFMVTPIENASFPTVVNLGASNGDAIHVSAAGFSGESSPNEFDVVLDEASQTVVSVTFTTFNDTPGIGDQCNTPDFLSQFEGLSYDEVENVETISGATMTSNSVIDAVLNAIEGGNQ